MGSAISCFSFNNHFQNAAVVLPINGGEHSYWEMPSLVFDVMMANPGHKLVKSSKFANKGVIPPMYFGDSLKPKRIYFLVPCDQEGKIDVGAELLKQVKKRARKLLKNQTRVVLPRNVA